MKMTLHVTKPTLHPSQSVSRLPSPQSVLMGTILTRLFHSRNDPYGLCCLIARLLIFFKGNDNGKKDPTQNAVCSCRALSYWAVSLCCLQINLGWEYIIHSSVSEFYIHIILICTEASPCPLWIKLINQNDWFSHFLIPQDSLEVLFSRPPENSVRFNL